MGPKLLRWNFLQISQLSIRSGAHKLFRQFLDFSQFLTAIYRKLWRHLTTEMGTMQCFWKSCPFWKKCKPLWNRPINGNATPVWTMSPSNEQLSGLGALQTKKKQTPHFRTYSRRALWDLPQTLHGDRARQDHQKRWHLFFDPTYSFSYRVHGKICPNWMTHGFSAITP